MYSFSHLYHVSLLLLDIPVAPAQSKEGWAKWEFCQSPHSQCLLGVRENLKDFWKVWLTSCQEQSTASGKQHLGVKKWVFAALHLYKFKHCLSLPGSVLKPGAHSSPWQQSCAAHGQKDALLGCCPGACPPHTGCCALTGFVGIGVGTNLKPLYQHHKIALLLSCFSAFRKAFAELPLAPWAWTKPGCYQSNFNSWFFWASHIMLLI